MCIPPPPCIPQDHFCAPTHVAVASDGSFFVSDGYCNSRVVAFTKEGAYAGEWSPPEAQGRMVVVHSLALDECRGLLYVADRERGRVFVLTGIECAPRSAERPPFLPLPSSSGVL